MMFLLMGAQLIRGVGDEERTVITRIDPTDESVLVISPCPVVTTVAMNIEFLLLAF